MLMCAKNVELDSVDILSIKVVKNGPISIGYSGLLGCWSCT